MSVAKAMLKKESKKIIFLSKAFLGTLLFIVIFGAKYLECSSCQIHENSVSITTPNKK